jgi:hypothetical protein
MIGHPADELPTELELPRGFTLHIVPPARPESIEGNRILAAAAAAGGAIDAAADIGEVAATRVRAAVEGTIQGVKVVAKKTVS